MGSHLEMNNEHNPQHFEQTAKELLQVNDLVGKDK